MTVWREEGDVYRMCKQMQSSSPSNRAQEIAGVPLNCLQKWVGKEG
jgi:hypothetical protein